MSDEHRPFEEAVAALSRYFVGDQTLGESLHQVAALTLRALPQTDHVGITLLVDGTLKTSVFTHPEVVDIDRAQYRTGEGPCIAAYRHGRPCGIGSTLVRGPWQQFRDSAAEHGVLSTLSMPMITHDGPIGALNMYAKREHAYSDQDQEVAALFATQAAFLLANAQAHWDAHVLGESLEQAMVWRATIEQAKGIVMSDTGCGPDEALDILIRRSVEQGREMRDVAADLVATTARRGRTG